MDISPLPHKAPFSFITERSLPSTPDIEEDMISPCELPPPPQFPTHQLQIPRPVSAAE
jgi:M-phase inducer tyrosine phosphatase